MKITVITKDNGEIVGTSRRNSASDKNLGPEEMRAEIVPMPGQQMHEIDVPDEVLSMENPDELHRCVKTYLSKHGL